MTYLTINQPELKIRCNIFLSIRMVAGDFPEAVMKTVDKYVPKSNCLFYSSRHTKSDERQSYFSAKNPAYGAEESFLEWLCVPVRRSLYAKYLKKYNHFVSN